MSILHAFIIHAVRGEYIYLHGIKHALLGLLLFPYLDLIAEPDYGAGFIENKGQWPLWVDYVACVPGGKMALRKGGFDYYFFDYDKLNNLHRHNNTAFKETNTASASNSGIEGRYIQVNFVGHNPTAIPVSSQRSDTYFNYFLGNEPQKWASAAYAFEQISYVDFYPGINLELSVLGENIKYSLVAAPGVDPNCIQLQYQGAISLSLFEDDLIVDGDLVRITEKKPVSYQLIDGVKKYISTRYELVGNTLSFAFPDGYDLRYELVIDPLLIFSTYSGFTADNWGSSATPGEKGTLYSTGMTFTSLGGTFGVTPGVFQLQHGGGISDIGILKYDSSGTKLLYASYLGGSDTDAPHSLLINHSNELLILGTTGSSNFPVTRGAYKNSFSRSRSSILILDNNIRYRGGSDIFVAKMSVDGRRLVASTYLGGSGNDGINIDLAVNYGDDLRGDLIVDRNDDVFIASVTSSQNLGAVGSFDTTYNGGNSDALLARLSPNLDTLHWAAFLGGKSADVAYSIKFNRTFDTLFVAGGTASSDFPVTQGAYKTTYETNKSASGWISKLPANGNSIKASTFIGASGYNQIYFIDLDEKDEVYAYGQKIGSFPITAGTYQNANSGQFLQKYASDLTQLRYSTTFGSGRGTIDISPTAFLVNGQCSNIYMAGWGGLTNTINPRRVDTNSIRNLWRYAGGSSTIGLPTTADAFQKETDGSDFYLAVFSKDASKLLYATFMGGSQSAIHVDGGTSRFDKSGIVYHAVCAGCGGVQSDFPTTDGSWSRNNNSFNCNNAAFKFDMSVLRANIITNSVARNNPGIRRLCVSQKIIFQNKSVGGSLYEWNFGDGTTASKEDKEDIEYMYPTVGKYGVELKAIDRQSCVGEDVDLVTIDVKAPAGTVGSDQVICHGQSAVLRAMNGSQYTWRQVGSDTPLSTSDRPVVSPEDTVSYAVTITDSWGCTVTDTVKISVVPPVDLKFTIIKKTDCNSRPSVILQNKSSNRENTFFDLGDGTTSDLGEVRHDYARDSTYRIRLEGRKDFCVYEKTVEFPALTVKVPNVITPSNSRDGKNDTFKIIYGEHGKLASESGINVSLSVYNRWGKQVFLDTHYQDNWSAAGLDPGVYYYKLHVADNPPCKGWVQVIK